ncbi:hypothetical protein BpHYR1_046012 [Brachionus plicatilis]|uniref:Uncharacterized protein n=1 Tax=Brachionus plicatilis TaxID=10195 RepID=A0A3M7Q1M4_BRAPC|nr:hypothetical protein BpHYR1_046012 [Brachionus plicatilis]
MDNTEQNLFEYREARWEFKNLNRQKIKLFFETQKSNDFKNSNSGILKFQNFSLIFLIILSYLSYFYGRFVNLQNDADFDSIPEELCWDVKKASTTVDQMEIFNSFLASIKSSSLSNEIKETVKELPSSSPRGFVRIQNKIIQNPHKIENL